MTMEHQLKIGIAGLGMVGSPLKRYFEEVKKYERGRDLFVYDTDPAKGYGDDINQAHAIFLCVPTPRLSSGDADTTAIDGVFRMLAGEKIVIIKSTVPPGTTEKFQALYPQHKVLFNPEFLTERRAWEETLHPDRQLVGSTVQSRPVAAAVLFLLPVAPVFSPSPDLMLSATEAEIIKYAANAFLARKVTFANAIFDLADHHRADYERIRAGIAADRRIGPSHLDVRHHGYRGYGGYCFVKDTDALIAYLKREGLVQDAALFEADRAFNTALLASQGLTPEEVAVHDQEWIQKKMSKPKVQMSNNESE
ncbi:MAG: hypothetical protein WAP52_03940 [Candidatus Sungiibacteriota bacterium]